MAWFSSLVDKNGKHLRAWSVVLLFAFFAASGVTNYFSGISDPNAKGCENAATTARDAAKEQETLGDEVGNLRIVKIMPGRTTIDRRVCIIVAGVVSKEFESRNAERIAKLRVLRDAARVALTGVDQADDAARSTAEAAVDDAEEQLKIAIESEANTSGTVLWVFLNGQPVKDFKVTARSISKPQVVWLDLDARGETDQVRTDVRRALVRSLWSEGASRPEAQCAGDQACKPADNPQARRNCLWDWIAKLSHEQSLSIGLSRSATDSAEVTSCPISLVLFNWIAAGLGLVSLVAFILLIVSLARNTTMLRDNDLTVGTIRSRLAVVDAELKDLRDKIAVPGADSAVVEAAKQRIQELENLEVEKSYRRFLTALPHGAANELPAGSYSLARTQIATWIAVVIGCYLLLWSVLGQYNGLITDTVLKLLGLSAIAMWFSIMANKADAKTWPSRAFHEDILMEDGGPTLHRLQAITWTLILAGLFVWIAFFKLHLPEFETNLLILLGISQGIYVGFKVQENRADQQAGGGGGGNVPAGGGNGGANGPGGGAGQQAAGGKAG
jgi:hypothetical protein